MIRYLITSHGHLDGVRLSRLGQWGNIPHTDEAEAREAARLDAQGQPHRVMLKDYPAPRR